MRSNDQTASIEWREGGVPVSTRFDDPYFSIADGLAETGHVFLAGNDLPARFCNGFHVAELGFGTGLNLLATLLAFEGQRLHYTSFEGWPMTAHDMARALAAFPEAAAVAGPLLDQWATGARRFQLGTVEVQVIIGDVQTTLAEWPGQADAWYLDGFSPAKNPEMWSPEVMAEVGRHTASGGTFATYTAAGHVRASLTAAGFQVERVAGHGTKRHMTRGRK